ncbi:hypothetical protein ES702_03131 [subsurface metagenome]
MNVGAAGATSRTSLGGNQIAGEGSLVSWCAVVCHGVPWCVVASALSRLVFAAVATHSHHSHH